MITFHQTTIKSFESNDKAKIIMTFIIPKNIFKKKKILLCNLLYNYNIFVIKHKITPLIEELFYSIFYLDVRGTGGNPPCLNVNFVGRF